MSNKKPAFLFYPGDWLRDPGVRQLSPREKGVYIELLIFLFDSGGYTALSNEDLMNTLNFRLEKTESLETCRVETFSNVIERLIQCGVVRRTEDGKLYNARIVRDMEERDEISQKRSEAGKKGAMAKWQNDGKAIANGWQTDGKQSEGCHEKEMAKDGYSFSYSSSISNNNFIKEKNNKKEKAQNRNQNPGTMPTSEQEAIDFCLGGQVPDWFIREKAYPAAVAEGFKTAGGNMIANWPQWVHNYWYNWKNKNQNEQQKKESKPLGRLYSDTPVRELKL